MRYKMTLKSIGLVLIVIYSTFVMQAQQLTPQFTFSINDLEIGEDDVYEVVKLNEGELLVGEEYTGKPQLPVTYFNLLLPAGAKATGVNITVDQETQLSGSFDLYPVQPPHYPNFSEQPEFVVQDPVVYGSNTAFPQTQLLGYANNSYRDYSFVSIAFVPFKYIPQAQELYLLTQITVQVTYTITTPGEPHKLRPYNWEDMEAFNVIQQTVVNPSQITTFYPEVITKLNISNSFGPVPGSPFETTPLPALEGSEVHYVVITNENLAPHFQEFVAWKTRNGTPAKIVTIDAIKNNYPGIDVPEKIRNFTKAAHQLWGTEYVLLGGDSEIIPVRKVKHSQYEMATDLYYAAIFPYEDNWNADGDNKFAENLFPNNSAPDYAEYTADIAIGRAPVDTPAEVENFIRKNVIYARSEAFAPQGSIPNGDWLGKALMAYGGLEDEDWYHAYCGLRVGHDIIREHHNNIQIHGMMEYYANRDYLDCNDIRSWSKAYYDLHGTCGTDIVIDDENLTHSNFMGEINSGYGLINIMDHGGPYGLGIGTIIGEPSFNILDVSNMADTNKYGILLASGCHSAPLEKELYMGEQWLNVAGGGAGYYGASEDVYIASTYQFTREFFDKLYEDNQFKFGKLHNQTAMNLFDISFYLSKIFQALGDPDLSIFTTVPTSMTVAHDTDIPLGNQNFEVDVSGFPGGEEVLVSVYKEGEVFAYKKTSNFPVTFDITPDTQGELFVTATCHNRNPYEGTVVVGTLSGTHLYKSDLTLTDANNNGIIEPGETISIEFELSNTGNTGATGISAELVANGTNVQITQNASTYPNIASGQTGVSNTDYVFTVSTEANPGGAIEFKLLIDSSQGLFIEPFLLNIQGSNLELGDKKAEVNGMETNVFNANETVELFIDVHNLGAVQAKGVNAVLTTNLPVTIANVVDNNYLYGDIESYSQIVNTDAFDITIGPNYNGENLFFELTLTDVFGKEDVFPIDLTEGFPPQIAGFGYTATHNKINLYWTPVSNIKGYNVYRADTELGNYQKINDFLLEGTALYEDFVLQPIEEYWYKISIVTNSGNELDLSLLTAYKTNTKLKRHPGFPIQSYPYSASSGLSSPIVYDVDGDGLKEIFLNYRNDHAGSTFNGRIMGFKANGQELFDIDGDPLKVRGFAETDLALWSNPAVGDIDNNGYAEVFAIGRKHEDNLGKLYGFHTEDNNSDGKPDVWETTLDPGPAPGPINIGNRAMRNPVLADLDNDEKLEVIVFDEHQRVIVYNHQKEKLGERNPFNTGYSQGEVAVADIDGDGFKEIVLACEKNANDKGAIYIWDHDGVFSGGLTDDLNLLKEFNVGERADGGPILADIDNDNKYEVLVTTKEGGTTTAGHVYALNIEDGSAALNNLPNITLPIFSVLNSFLPRIAVGDLNHDGNLEIVFGSYSKLYVIDNMGTNWPGFPLTIEYTGQSAPILADIDEDDDIEIIINNMVYNGSGQQLKGVLQAYNIDGSSCRGWDIISDTGSPFVGSPYIGDIDDDGFNEVVISSEDFTTYVWDTTGDADKVEWGSYRENAQNTAVYKEECTFSNSESVQINGGANVTWSTGRHIQGNLVVKPNASLTINNATITFTRNSKLIIEPGGKLTINGGVLTTECGALWKGIRVQGNYNAVQTPTNQGTLIVKNNATVAHAEIGIYVGTDPSITTINNGAGGLIEIDDSAFRDNIIGIDMPSYPNNTASYIRNSIFENSEYLTNREAFPTANIRLWKVKPIMIENNTFRNLQPIDPYTVLHDLPIQGNGIVGTDAKLDVLNNNFENLNSAITLQATGSAFSTTYVNISENTFENNWNAVSLNSIDGVEITSNAIAVFDTFLDGQGVDGSSGLYIVNSNGFHIENNNIYSSTAQGFSTGIFIRDCQAVNEIYRNQLTDLYTGIFAMGLNIKASSGLPDLSQGLQLICNEFNDNSTHIYVAPLARIANYQGTPTLAAGNTFLPECSAGVNEFNNQGYQINYLGETGGIYLPACNYNVNVFSNAGHNGCESTLGRPYGSTDLAQSEMELEQNKTQYFAVTDGGDTEALNEAIDETEYNEALELRNQLLEESPFLSDTIMVKTTAVEDVLPAIMVKEILVANPKAAKSDKIQLALDARQNPLPIYMRNEIEAGKTILSPKEELEAHLSKSFYTKENILNRMMLSLKKDSVTSSLDSLETILVSEIPKNLNRNYQLMDFYLSRNETQNAQTVFNNMPQNFALNPKEQNEYNKMDDLLEVQRDIIDGNKSLMEVDSEQISILTLLAVDSTTIAGMKSRAILSLVNGTDYGLPIPEKIESSGREVNGTDVEPGTLKVSPEVAKDYFIIEYKLNDNEKVNDASLRIVNVDHKEMKSMNVLKKEDQLLIECATWSEGIYWCEKIVNNRMVDRKKVFVDRSNQTVLNVAGNVSENDKFFQLYPNPAKDYFFVKTNSIGKTVQISNSLGQIIKEYTINDITTKISTLSWSRGVYYVSLLNGNLQTETIKIIVD